MTQRGSEFPEKFYKYRAMTPEQVQRVEQIVLGNEIYFAPPSSFNDPFDLNPAFSLDGGPELQRDYYLGLSRKYRPDLSEAEHIADADNVIANSLSSENRPQTEALIQWMSAQALNNVGVFCVSTKCDDILMWSHYADSHCGVSLVFDGMSLLMAHAQPPMATSNSPTFGQSNSPMAGRSDYDVSSLVTMRAAASLRR